MKTNFIITNKQSEAIKQINKIRLANKNNWYQINLTFGTNVFKFKMYDTWIQLGYKYDLNNNLITTFDNGMDRTIMQWKTDLAKVIYN